jgi:hypothetical protein
MKTKILVLIPLLILTLSAQAQILKIGVNSANVTITNDGDIDEARSLTTFQAGVLLNVKFLPFISFQPGILFTGKGTKTQSGETTDPNYFRATSNPFYVEVPANFLFKTPGPIKVFFGGGPYIAMGIAGRNKTEGKFLGVAFNSEEDIIWSDDDPSTLGYEEGSGFGIMKKFDYGVNGLAGIETKNIILSLNYGLGLAKLQSGSGSGEDDKNKHRVITFGVGIKL